MGLRAWIVVLASAPGALAQEAALLRPQAFSVGVGESVKLAFPADRLDHLFVRAGGTQANIHRVDPGDDGRVALRMERADASLIGVTFRPVVVEMLRADMEAIVGADHRAGAPADKGVRVRRVECAAALVRVVGEGPITPSITATSKAGLDVEIRPLVDPTAMRAAGDVPVRVYLDGEARGGVRLAATHESSGRVVELTSNPSGTAVLRVDGPGVWRIEVRISRRLEGDAEAEWEVRTGALVFEVPEFEGAQGVER